MAGYHLAEIPRGEFGELSKIAEELAEIQDAVDQKCVIMELCELSDLYGAVRGYLSKYHPDVTMHDLEAMANITGRTFASGGRG